MFGHVLVCHSLRFVAFRDLRALGYNERQIKAFAHRFEIQDGPDREEEMFRRSGRGQRIISLPPLPMMHRLLLPTMARFRATCR